MGALSNLGNSIKRRLGLTGPSEQELRAISNAAQVREQAILEQQKVVSREEAAFLQTEGRGLKRQARITFGDAERSKNLSAERKSLRSSGRFTTDRLVL